MNVQDATLLVNAPITGSGTVSVGLAGTIGGSSTIASPVTANSGGTIAPGGLAGSGLELAALGTGHLTLGAGRAQGARASRPRPNPRSANFDAHRPGRMARCAVWRSGAGRPRSLTQRAIKTPSFQQPDCEVCMIFALRPGAVNGLDMGTES